MSTSPYHVRRVEEKNELQSLNHRLEHYVLHTKDIADERDRLAAELEATRRDFAAERKALQKRHETVVKTLRVEINELRSSLSAYEAKCEEYEAELPPLKAKLRELDAVRKERDALRAEVEPLQAEVKDLKSEITRLLSQVKELQRTNSKNEKLVITLEQSLESSRDEVTTLQEQLDGIDARHKAELKALRDSMTANLAAARHEWERANAQKIGKLERDLKEKYEKEMEELQKLNEKLQEQVRRLTEANMELKSDIDRKSAYCTELIARIAKFEEEQNDADWTDKYRALEKEISALHERMLAKDVEFNDLMDLKISLEAEIEHYRRILDGEEKRTGWTPTSSRRVEKEDDDDDAAAAAGAGAGAGAGEPVKTPKTKGKKGKKGKGKLSSRKQSTKVRTRTEVKVKEDSVAKRQRTLVRTVTHSKQSDVDCGIDLELDLIADTVKITNNTDDDLDLTGWVLCSEVGTQNFSFPDGLVLAAGEHTTVWSGKGAHKHHKPPQHLFWTKRFIWNNDGDTAVLKDPAGNTVQMATSSPLELGEVDAVLKEDDGKENCVVM